MAAAESPTIQRGRLRAELRRARREAGLTQEQVAAEMEWSLSKLIRIEGGSVNVSVTDLRALLSHYQITDPEEVGSLVALARASRERSWANAYKEIISPQYVSYIEYESAAAIIRQFEPLLVPSLLQTEEYMHALLGGEAPVREFEDAHVRLRLRRQELLENKEQPELYFVVDEAAVRRHVGGAEAMRRQLGHLLTMAARDNITIEIVPFSAGIHPGLRGPLVLFEFPDPRDDDVLYLENSQRGRLSTDFLIGADDPDVVIRYREMFESLREASLGPDMSRALLKRLIDELQSVRDR